MEEASSSAEVRPTCITAARIRAHTYTPNIYVYSCVPRHTVYDKFPEAADNNYN